MPDNSFTLIDVMLGIRKHGLVCKLSEESFTFLIGLILEHNDKGFKIPFDLTNQQAMAVGGGNTPKSVRRRRLTLSKFKIDGKPLLKFTSGNYGRSTCAKYEINYEKLLLYNGAWTKENDLPAQKRVSSGHSRGRVEGTVGGTVPGPILRSDQKKEEKKEEVTTVNLVSKEEAERFGMHLRDFRNNCCNPNIAAHMEILRRITTQEKQEKAIELAKVSQDEGVYHWEFMAWLDERLEG